MPQVREASGDEEEEEEELEGGEGLGFSLF